MSKEPPHCTESESCVLGSMLLEPRCIPAIQLIVRPDDFYTPCHSLIFTSLIWVYEHPKKYGQLDLVVFKNALTERQALTKVTGTGSDLEGIQYIAALAEGVPNAANAEYYARIVRDRARLRNLITCCGKLIEEAYRTPEAEEFMGRAQLVMQSL